MKKIIENKTCLFLLPFLIVSEGRLQKSNVFNIKILYLVQDRNFFKALQCNYITFCFHKTGDRGPR